MTQTGLLVRLKRIALVTATTIAATTTAGWAFGIRINTSPSLPTGLYVASVDQRASMAVFCLDEPYASFAIARGYRTAGSCRDGGTPLMKPVVAKTGDTVVFDESGVSVNGRLLPNSSPASSDSHARPLHHFPFGTYQLPSGTVWVISSRSARSYDSRYFGPIRTSTIQSRVVPLVTLD